MPANPPTLPELPVPSVTAGAWPTYFLSLAERHALGNGTVQYAKPNISGQFSQSPNASQTTSWQGSFTSAKPTHALGHTQPVGLPFQRASLVSSQQPIRSTAPSMTALLLQPIAKAYTNASAPIRSTAPSVSALASLSSPMVSVQARQRLNRLSIFSLLFACGSFLALICVSVVTVQSAVLWIVFVSAFVALFLGIRSVFQRGASRAERAFAAGGITISSLSAIIEIIRLIARV